jgi:hypothetical protein
MPLEIRELVIKASIGNTAPPPESSSHDQAAIIAACVEQVLATLKEKAER